jgi:nucleoside-diphosphate-sugar epimerase
MPVWLVTGGSGFLGRHLLATLAERAPDASDVVALGRRCPRDWPLEAFVRADLDDSRAVARAVEALEPSVVFHLAGQTPPASPEQFYQANTRATVHLIEALQARNQPARVVLAGSAAELGPIECAAAPIGEDALCRPSDAYALSKWFAGQYALAASSPLEVLVARVFNPCGPGMPASQAFGRFAQKLKEPGPDPVRLAVRDLESRRDFVDVRDVARAFLALALRGRSGLVYHVGAGQSHSVAEGLEVLIRLSGRAVILEPGRGGQGGRGPRVSCADIRRIAAHTGWEPRVGWEQSLADLWDEVRARPLLPLTASPLPV